MKFSFSKNILKLLPVLAGTMIFSSCKKIFDVEPKNVVDQKQMYRNVFDADAAVIGIYGKFMKLARQYVLLNELRADMMDVTSNADMYLRQLNNHTVSSDNPYINPLPFYEVIINCNDVMKNFDIMLKDNKFKVDEYKQRYSDVAAIRTWVYLQLGIQYGNVPYVTDPLQQVSDLYDQSKFPMLPLDRLIDSLVSFTERLPFTDDYPVGTTLQTVVDGYPTQKFFINKNILMGDLYLWDGQYDKAADRFKRVMEINGPSGNTELFYNQYRISSFGEAGITYARINDVTSLNYTTGWRYLFERPQDNQFNWEWIWVLPFDKSFAPENPFIDLFSPIGGNYLVKPSQQAIDYWNNEKQAVLVNLAPIAAMPFDARGILTYRYINGQPVIMKYLYNYLNTNNVPINLLSKTGKWFLSRAATLHLHYAEAANRAGQYKVAYAITNRGIRDAYDNRNTGPLTADSVGFVYNSYVQNRDVTNIEQTRQPYPYDFDARQGDGPAYRSNWYRNQGIRGRANLFAKKLPATDSVTNVETMIIEEDALELAYEGQRWSDLLRIAIRRNDPSFVADKVYNKLIKSGASAGDATAARNKLMARNWFLPFKWQ